MCRPKAPKIDYPEAPPPAPPPASIASATATQTAPRTALDANRAKKSLRINRTANSSLTIPQPSAGVNVPR